MTKEHIMIKDGTAYLTDHPHLKVHLVAQMHVEGEVAIANVAQHYGVTLADVYASIAYYYDNQQALSTAHADKVKRAKILGKENFRIIADD